MTVFWTDDMIRQLRRLRARRMPLLLCAEVIGVCYPLAVRKARELGLAGRMNRGRIPGMQLAAEGRHT